MGPWRSIRHRLEETVRTSTAEGVQYVGRTWKASPSEGYPTAHQREQDRIVRVARGRPQREPEWTEATGCGRSPWLHRGVAQHSPDPDSENQWR